MKLNFTCTLEKLFILNPSYMGYAGWKLIKPHLHPVTQDKIKVLKSGEITQIYELINKDQLEAKYGGSNPDLVSFW
jgi:hypothetical protein